MTTLRRRFAAAVVAVMSATVVATTVPAGPASALTPEPAPDWSGLDVRDYSGPIRNRSPCS